MEIKGLGMPIRIIATDIDHTLLDERGNLPPINAEALQMAVQRGIHVILATARRREPTLGIARMLGIPATLVCHNGARIWDHAGREIVHMTLDMAVARRLADIGDAQRLPFVFTVDEINYFNPASMNSKALIRNEDRAVSSLHEALHTAPTRVVAQGMKAIKELKAVVANEDQVHVYQYSRPGAELHSAIAAHPAATKENALAMLCEAWNVPASAVIALGDAEADAGMLRWAGVGVALKGSMPEALAAANWIAPSARLGGLAVAIHRYVLI
jgi:5-amino-6-(5-phospho-D-ribitylamino)uracil phosphatase